MCPLVPPSGVLVSPFVYFSLFQSDTQTPSWPAAIIFYFKQCMVVTMKENAILLNVWGPLIIGRGSSLAPIDTKLRLLIYHLIDYQSTLRRFVTGPISPIWTNYLLVLTIISSPSVHDTKIEHIPWFLVAIMSPTLMQFCAFFHNIISFIKLPACWCIHFSHLSSRASSIHSQIFKFKRLSY